MAYSTTDFLGFGNVSGQLVKKNLLEKLLSSYSNGKIWCKREKTEDNL